MGDVLLVTGGVRSGKSAYALQRAEAIGGRRIYLATAPALGVDMEERIERHKRERAASGWETVEETTALADALRRIDPDAVVLLDCLTLWVNNLLHEAQTTGASLDEVRMQGLAEGVCAELRARAGSSVLVTNEVGMGVLPGNRLARVFCDLAGRCNQVVARHADEVVCMVSGMPLTLKASTGA